MGGATELDHYPFPAANRPIITAARLPHHYAILDDADEALLLPNLQKILNRGVKLIQARLKNLSSAAVAKFVEQAYPLCQQRQAVLLMNSAVDCPVEVDGIHLTSRDLMALTARPENIKWLAASCHNLEQLQHAQKIGVDFVVLAPVLATQTHPGAKVLGWEQFADLVAKVNLPVYALGGMTEVQPDYSAASGGQGIAAIGLFWIENCSLDEAQRNRESRNPYFPGFRCAASGLLAERIIYHREHEGHGVNAYIKLRVLRGLVS